MRRYGLEVFTDTSVPAKVLLLGNRLMPHGGTHAHDYFQISYVHKGECEHRIGKSLQYLVPGDIFVIPPDIPHSLRASPGSTVQLFLCDFMTRFLSENFRAADESKKVLDFACIEPFLVSENMVRPRIKMGEASQVEVERLLFAMEEEGRTRRPGYRLTLRAHLLQLLVLVWREYERAETDRETDRIVRDHVGAVNSTLSYLETNYQEPLTLQDACRHAGMSQSYFSKFFKLVTKKTFVEYMHDLRIVKATDLLRDTDLKIIDVCHEVGFSDVTHFNRVFRNQKGVSPSEYRRTAV